MDMTKISGEEKTTALLRGWAVFGFTVMLGLCELKGGICVLPLCLLIAVGEPCFPVFAGAFAASLVTSGGVYLHTAVIMAVYALQWLLQRKKRVMAVGQKVCVAFFASAVVAAGELMAHNLIFEDLLRTALVFLFIPFSVCALDGFFCKTAKKMRRELGVVMAAFFAVKAFYVLDIGGYGAAPAVAAFITLWLSEKGFAFGSVCGFFCGMSCGMAYMPMMGIMGFCHGMFCDVSRVFSVVFAFLLSGAVDCYLVGFPEAIPGVVSSLVGCAAYVVFEKRLPEIPLFGVAVRDSKINTESRLSAAFSSLSQAFFTVGHETEKLKKDGLNDKVKENVFAVCEKCRGCECDKYDLVNHLCETLWKKRLCVFSDLPRHIQGSCKNSGELIFAANSVVTNGDDAFRDGMTNLAEEYLAFSRLICSADRATAKETTGDPGKAKRVRALLHDKGISFKSVTVTGNRQIKVVVRGVDPTKIKLSSAEITYMLSALLTAKLSEPEFILTGNDTEMRLVSIPTLRVECAKATVGKDGETVCGDTVSFFESDNGYFYSLISDGMGSGREAELASRLASIFLEKLLALGADASETLDMLNRMLIMKDEEIFTTVDLLEIDRMTGNARMIKAGAAPTFVYRNGECYRLDACTAPIGIISEVKAAETKMKLKRGDFIVMTSDGITPADPKPCLPKVGEKRTAATLATAIITAWSDSATSSDDMSVSVVRIA